MGKDTSFVFFLSNFWPDETCLNAMCKEFNLDLCCLTKNNKLYMKPKQPLYWFIIMQDVKKYLPQNPVGSGFSISLEQFLEKHYDDSTETLNKEAILFISGNKYTPELLKKNIQPC